MIMKFGMEHYELKLYTVYINDDSELFLTYFTTMSNLANFVFVLILGTDIRCAFTGPLVLWFYLVTAITSAVFSYKMTLQFTDKHDKQKTLNKIESQHCVYVFHFSQNNIFLVIFVKARCQLSVSGALVLLFFCMFFFAVILFKKRRLT